MKPTGLLKSFLLALGLLLGLLPKWASAELLEQDFTNISINTISEQGMPLSDKVNDPSGSNGLAPSTGTAGQFGGFMAFGSSASPKYTNLSPGKSYFENADKLGLPKGSKGSKSYVLSRASVGAPMYGRKVNFLFGQIVGKPSAIGAGEKKTLIGTPSTYWADEPFIPTLDVTEASELKGYATITTERNHGLLPGDIVVVNGVKGIEASNLTVLLVPSNKSFTVLSSIDSTGQVLDALNAAADDSLSEVAAKALTLETATMRKAHESLGYYYSPHGKCVVSIQPGPVEITWRERASISEQPTGEENINWTQIKGAYYNLHSVKYTVSASSSKQPQSIYWNKEPISDGPLVVLPDGLGDVKVVFSKIFPERVSPENAIPLLKTGTGQSAEVELRTLWVNQVSPSLRVLTAFNTTGRVIVEMLGDLRSDGTRQHLGFEIVDVSDYSVSSDIVLDLGDRVLPFKDGAPINDESIVPDIRDRGDSGSGGFAIKKGLPGTQQMAYYAIKETEYPNDLVAYWLRESIAGLAWPVYHNRYHLQWPVDSARYSQYLRPEGDRSKAIETAVNLPAENSTAIFYQDKDSFGNNRATIDGVKFYSWLDSDYPTHRTLLGHETVKGGMAFEHVMSWLDTSIQQDKWPSTEQVKHLDLWPKFQVEGNHGIPAEATGGITARLFNDISKGPENRINLANSSKWTAGTGAGGSADNQKFTLNGDGNIRELGFNPLGLTSLLWSSVNNDSASNADGGWNKYINGLSDTKGYMSIVYVKRAGNSTNGRFYHGCDKSYTDNLSGSQNTNPYFNNPSLSILPKDVWCVSVGIIRAKDGQKTSAPGSFVYRLDTGSKLSGNGIKNAEYKMRSGGNRQTHRNYLYYSTDPKARLDWWNPGLYEINGNEPTLADLLGADPDRKGDGKIITLVQGGRLNDLPDLEVTTNLFEWPSTGNQNYATQFLGYFHPSKTGYHTFGIASDNQGELYLSTDANPANAHLVSSEGTFSEKRKYSKADLSSTRYLEKGKAYYIESIHTQVGGADNMAVSYVFSDAPDKHSSVPDDIEPIKGKELSAWSSKRDLTGGLSVRPLKYSFEKGQFVEFANQSKFTFLQPANIGDTVVYGSLDGMVFNGNVGTQPTVSVMPEVQASMAGGKPKSLKLNRDNSQVMNASVKTGNTDIAIELWFRTEHTSGSELGIINFNDSWGMQLTDSGFIRFRGKNATSEEELVDDVPYNDGQWHHLGLTFNSGDLTRPSDAIWASSQEGSNPGHAIDNKTDTFYSNTNTSDTGFTVQTVRGRVDSMALTSNPNHERYDPISYQLYGSSNEGRTFLLISTGEVPEFDSRQQRQLVTFSNTQSYTRYLLKFPETKGGGAMEISEVELIDSSSETGMKLFVDGKLKINNSNKSHIAQSEKIQLGRVKESGSFFDGELDEVRIWNTPRSKDEIEKYWEAILPSSEPGLLAYYSFDQIDGNTVPDLTTNNHDGSLTSNGSLTVGINLPSVLKVSPLQFPINMDSKIVFGAGASTFESIGFSSRGDTEILGYLTAPVSVGDFGQINDTTLDDGPRAIQETVDVGRRLKVPSNEKGADGVEKYWAGYIHSGTAYNPNAYINPLGDEGFELANNGAIIPVNADPSNNKLTVYWFREKTAKADPTLGYLPIYWPSVIADYTIKWPDESPEIVLASNSGSGALNSLQQKGVIYRQNDKSLPGYNPNEEHALLLGGYVWALRCDLNQNNGTGYTSAPFVLLEYVGDDGRLSMTAFKVLPEKPLDGILFDYITEAGKILQAPQPLPLLDKPTHETEILEDGIVVHEVGDPLDREVPYEDSDKPKAWSNTPKEFTGYEKFTTVDRNNSTWVYRGPHSGIPEFKVGTYDSSKSVGDRWSKQLKATAVVGEKLEYHVHTSILAEHLQMTPKNPGNFPEWLSISGLVLEGVPPQDLAGENLDLVLVVSTMYGESIDFILKLSIEASGGTILSQSNLDVVTDNGARYIGRPPYLSDEPAANNSFKMKFWYKNLAEFDWPSDADKVPGESIQYLSSPDELNGKTFHSHGDRDYVIYRPVWPKSAPILKRAETLTVSKFGLPAVRGQTSVKVLYEESLTKSEDRLGSVKLHDPTREKVYEIPESVEKFPPADVLTSMYRGKTYFPKLPPHLNKRIFFDPNRGNKGALVFRGEFMDEIVGEKYLQLNLISDLDKEVLFGVDGDSNKPAFSTDKSWKPAIKGLETILEPFKNKKRSDNSKIPGVYEIVEDHTLTVEYDQLSEIHAENVPVDSYALSASGPGSGFVTIMVGNGNGKVTPEGDPVSMHIIKVSPTLYQGELKVIYAENPLAEKVSIRHSGDFGGEFKDYEFEWRKAYPVDGQSPKLTINDSINPQWIKIDSASGVGKPSFVHGAGATGIDTLLDVYYIVKYRPVDGDDESWSEWTKAKFVEGWIKRVLAGINPFNQRVKDLYSNEANTDASMMTQAGKRWEGDVALSLESINDFGLIEIYETVLNRGKMLSIESDINNPGANQALLLAAGYLNDLYMMLGNEAFADAANPTIGFGTGDGQYGDIATSMFAFKGQVASLMDEELGLLRGRDDFLQPDVEVAPVYNRMFWNFTRGIDSGEVIYALNYNIQERDGEQLDGNINAADASHMYPQGHGDAYGHYLTAIKGYYSLLADNDFQWIPQTEAVSVLGQEVSVDYMDERKFAAAALALARTGTQVYELTWRKDYIPSSASGWSHMAKTRTNERRSHQGADGEDKNPTRYWGQDHWAARVGSGSYLNWVVGNAMVPEIDTDPTHEGIKRVDRTTVLELIELSELGRELQLTADSAASGVNPLGLPEDTVPFDISPDFIVESNGGHMDQMYERAVMALDNAVSAFDSSKDITQMMRTEEDSLADLQVAVEQEELAYKHRLIEIYGTPYPDDIGPGKLYKQGYDGPDLLHFEYIERAGLANPSARPTSTYTIDIQEADVTDDFASIDEDPYKYRFNLIRASDDPDEPYTKGTHYREYVVDNFGFFLKPVNFTGRRNSPGEIQTAIAGILSARAQLDVALGDVDSLKGDLDVMIGLFNANAKLQNDLNEIGNELDLNSKILANTKFAVETLQEVLAKAEETASWVKDATTEAMPDNVMIGFSNGGTFLKPVKAVPHGIMGALKELLTSVSFIAGKGLSALELGFSMKEIDLEGEKGDLELKQALKEALIGIGDQISAIGDQQSIINARARALENARMRYATLKAEGDRILLAREIFRKRSASKVHKYRTRDAAFRIFRNEKLERYKSMFDLAARYTYFAAKAYDYETGQLGSDAGQRFLSRIVSSRALGVVQDGAPQFAGSNMGDPGLSSVLAEMKADWSVLRGRLGINNPDTYGTTASLRTENHRILPGSAGTTAWIDVLQKARKRDILADPDVKKLCMQLANDNGLPVPGIVLEFQTTIADGFNLFGKQLASGDHAFSPTSYANKILGVGVILEGYEGMDYTEPTGGPTVLPVLLNPKGLSATPYVYLIPCGLDAMRSPPLGDQSVIRVWDVQDATIPMPFNIGASEFETKPMWQTSDSLSEQLFNVRKHQAFRAVDNVSFFRGGAASEPPNPFTNNRLIGRSVWNSKWKLVIPGKTLLDDPQEGLDLFINTVKDIKIHFETYSYSGN